MSAKKKFTASMKIVGPITIGGTDNGKPLTPQESDLLEHFTNLAREQRIAELALLEGTPKAMDKFHDKRFMAIAYAYFGDERAFASDAAKALKSGDTAFFETVSEVIKTIKAKSIKRPKRDERPDMAIQVFAAFLVVDSMVRKGKPEPTIAEFDKAIQKRLEKIGVRMFDSDEARSKVRTTVGMGHLKQIHQGRSKNTIGKGKLAKGWDG